MTITTKKYKGEAKMKLEEMFEDCHLVDRIMPLAKCIPMSERPYGWMDCLKETALMVCRENGFGKARRVGWSNLNKLPIRYSYHYDKEKEGYVFGNAKDRKRGMAAIKNLIRDKRHFIDAYNKMIEKEDSIVVKIRCGSKSSHRNEMKRIRKQSWYVGELEEPVYKVYTYVMVRPDDIDDIRKGLERDAWKNRFSL